MSIKYVLRKEDGTFFALANSLTAESDDLNKATLFDTHNEAVDWRDNHAIHCVKLKQLGFEIYPVEI